MNSIFKPIPLQPDARFASGDHGRWRASLELVFAARNDRTVLQRNRHQGPLYVQKPFYPEGQQLPHIYLLHPPGGMVSGDELSIDIAVQERAKVLITTPGAGRIYRARADRDPQRQSNHLRVADQAYLEWFPQETIVFNDAQALVDTTVNLDGSARFCGWDLVSLGLPANAIRFQEGMLQQTLQIHHEGRPVLIERLLLDAGSRDLMQASCGFRGKPISGILVAGPLNLTTTQMQVLQQYCEQVPCAAVSQVGSFVVARYLGDCSEQAKKLFVRLWGELRPVLDQREICIPRIWAT